MQSFGRKYSLSSNVSSGQTSSRLSGTKVFSNLCNRCKKFEEELLNNSDNLSATNTELKASRQCISLLQREIQLLRQQNLDLEKLVISPSNDNSELANTTDLIDNDWNIVIPNSSSVEDVRLATIEKTQLDREDKLLRLIRGQIYEKSQEILNVNLKLKKAEDDKEHLNNQLIGLQEENSKLKNDNAVFIEMLELRDQTVVSLTNELFETGAAANNNNRRRQSEYIPTLPSSILNKSSTMQPGRSQSKLIETINAYKKQNEILSTNVIRLTDKCQQSERREIELRSQCHELEAKCCQIQSKLLSLLKEIDQSTKQRKEEREKIRIRENGTEPSNDKTDDEVVCSESVKFLIKRLLEDKSLDIPLSWKEGNHSTSKHSTIGKIDLKNEYDDLGFHYPKKKEETSDVNLNKERDESEAISRGDCPLDEKNEVGIYWADNENLTMATILEDARGSDPGHTSGGSLNNLSTREAKTKWRNKWDNFIKNVDSVDLSKSKEFKNLLRSGCPHEYRVKIWKSLINLKVGQVRNTNYGPDYYQCLLNPHPTMKLNPSAKQIELDLLRTLPNNRHFESLDANGTIRLRRVLTAYSLHNPSIGYCQGMNRLAALALLVLPEEEAFWCLVTIIEYIMPPGYYSDLWLAQVDSSVAGEYIGIKMPLINDHLERHGIELSLFAWFLTIFVDGMPPDIFLRCWDCFLYEGDKVLFRVALALIKVNENRLLQMTNSASVNSFLRSFANLPIDVDHVFDVAFNWMNPLSHKSLKSKRQNHYDIIRAEIDFNNHDSHNASQSKDADSNQLQHTDSKRGESLYDDSKIISI